MTVQKVIHFLDSHKVKFVTITHSRAFTAQDTAESADIPGREVAKTVMINIGERMVMAVLPAPFHVDFDLLRMALKADSVKLAEEAEFSDMFPDCEVGAMPPFGNLYGMDVFVDEQLTTDRKIVFHAGSLNEVIRMSYADFRRLVKPVILNFSMRLDEKLRAA